MFAENGQQPRGDGQLRGAEIRHLAALQAVARERSLRGAARRLGCAQSAVSQHLSELEAAVGLRLVDRAPRSAEAVLTEAGELVLTHADAVVARVAAARADIELIGNPQPLRVGVYESIAMHVLPAVLRRLEGLPIAAREADGDAELLNAIEQGEADLAFAELPLPPGPFEWTKILEEPYVLVVPARSELGEGEAATMPLVGRRSGRFPDAVEARLGPQRIARRADTDAGVRSLVAAGVGAAILPRLSLEPSDTKIVAIDLGGGLGSRDVVLVSHRFRRLPVAAARFRGVAAGVCAELARSWAAPE